MQFGWQNVSDKTYYFGKNGSAETGETTIQGTTYNFRQEGALNQGWSENGKNYYNDQGLLVTQLEMTESSVLVGSM